MGVRGLETFLEKQCPQACRQVNIKGLVDKYKREKNTGTLLIVVDGLSCLRYLYNDLNWLFGGQLKEYVRRIQNFVNAFQAIGITLVVFFDGTSVQRKRPTWIRRRANAIKDVYTILDTLRKGQLLTADDEKLLFTLPCGLGIFARYIFKQVCKCDVRTSVRECDEEIAAFARENRCFAILGQDTDYVIYEGGDFYLSMKNLNLCTMQTLCYDRSAFASLLRIPLWHLPLVATLCGNDIVSSDSLKEFHSRECQEPHRRGRGQHPQYVTFSRKVHGVANYIRRKRFDRELKPHALSTIAWDVFRNEFQGGLIESSVQSYLPQPDLPETVPETNWCKILSMARQRHVSGEISAMYSVMVGAPFELCTGLEDFRLCDLPSAAALLRPLRQRVYGILLKEKEGERDVKEWCVDGEIEEEWEKSIAPIFSEEDPHWRDILDRALEIDKAVEIFSMYPTLLGHDYKQTTLLKDLRLKDLPLAAALLRPLQKKTYGILLIEKKIVEPVEEWCVIGEDMEQWQKRVDPAFPEGEMGVVGLEAFLERECPQACRRVKIERLVEQYKQNYKTEKALLLVDGSNCLRFLYCGLNGFLGGQMKEFVGVIQNFVEAFKSIGITPVFYFDGYSTLRLRESWNMIRTNDLKIAYQTFDLIQENNFAPEHEKFIHPCGIAIHFRNALKYLFNCDVKVSLNEGNKDIVPFTRDNKCFAILAQNTDYVIYDVGAYYFSMKDLDLRSMETTLYDRCELAKSLEILPWQLPLLATLVGRSYADVRELKDFHLRMCVKPHERHRFSEFVPFRRRLLGIANYILRRCYEGVLGQKSLTSIAWDVFRDESRTAFIKNSVQLYNPQREVAPDGGDSNWGKILSVALENHTLGLDSTVYPIISGAHFELCTAMEDFRLGDLPSAAALFLPLRQRVYGILMMEKEGDKTVLEWCINGEDVEEWEKMVAPVFPGGVEHPGLLALWSDDATLSDTRWELFVRSVTPQLSAAALRDLPSRLVVPAAILAYLRCEIPVEGEPYLHEWELDAMAIQAVLLPTTDPSLIVVEPPYATRAIRLATVFMRSVSHMLLLLAATGFPIPLKEAMPWEYFDGKLFHSTYKSLMEPELKTVAQLCVNQAGESVHEEYLLLRAIV